MKETDTVPYSAVPGSGGGGSELILTATPGQGYFPPEDRDALIGSFVAAIEPFTTLEQVTYSRKSSSLLPVTASYLHD